MLGINDGGRREHNGERLKMNNSKGIGFAISANAIFWNWRPAGQQLLPVRDHCTHGKKEPHKGLKRL
jgi:hypothetical protein